MSLERIQYNTRINPWEKYSFDQEEETAPPVNVKKARPPYALYDTCQSMALSSSTGMSDLNPKSALGVSKPKLAAPKVSADINSPEWYSEMNKLLDDIKLQIPSVAVKGDSEAQILKAFFKSSERQKLSHELTQQMATDLIIKNQEANKLLQKEIQADKEKANKKSFIAKIAGWISMALFGGLFAVGGGAAIFASAGAVLPAAMTYIQVALSLSSALSVAVQKFFQHQNGKLEQALLSKQFDSGRLQKQVKDRVQVIGELQEHNAERSRLCRQIVESYRRAGSSQA